MTQVLGSEKQGLFFEIISADISGEDSKKYVVYSIQVGFISGKENFTPPVITRRYSQFLQLYNSLKKEEPQLMKNTSFPKKVLFGNFDHNLIAQRTTDFQTLLNHVSSESKLRCSKAMMNFLQDNELTKAKEHVEKHEYLQALPLFEQSFLLLNKVFTDRSAVVILTLCRIISCCTSIPDMNVAHKWAQLALHRYEGISDSDLLELYIPLLNSCITIWSQLDKDTTHLESTLKSLKQQGICVKNANSLLDSLNIVEKRIFK